MGPRAGLDGAEILFPTGIRSRTLQPVAHSLYRLSYPAHQRSLLGVVKYTGLTGLMAVILMNVVRFYLSDLKILSRGLITHSLYLEFTVIQTPLNSVVDSAS